MLANGNSATQRPVFPPPARPSENTSCLDESTNGARLGAVPRLPSFAPGAPPDVRFARLLRGRLAAMTCLFNPCRYKSRGTNYHRFAKGLREQRVPLYCIELAFGDQPFFLGPGPTVVRLRTRHVLWHKERLLNLLLNHVPEKFDKIAWIDADLLFTNPDWAEHASRLLEQYPVVQLFDRAVQLDKRCQPDRMSYGIARARATRPESGKQLLAGAHPGLAWAARRELLHRYGLLDNNILGGADAAMVGAMYGWWDFWHLKRFSPALRRAVDHWMRPFHNDVQGQVGYVPGAVLHLWHGDRGNRRYTERLDLLTQSEFDPGTDLQLSSDGVWEWSGTKPELEREVRDYFAVRREDD